MRLGKLNFIFNSESHHAADSGYYHVLVFDAVEDKFEELMITKSEMGRIRLRSAHNKEDSAGTGFFDRFIASFYRSF